MFCRIEDVGNDPNLRDLLQVPVKEVVVEFTNGGPDMPHAELRLILAQGVDLNEDNRTKTIHACSMGSNPHLVPRPNLGTYSTTTFRTEEKSYGNTHSFVSFIFKPREGEAKVREYLSALGGELKPWSPHSTNILQFDSLVRMPDLEGKLGYESRDVVAQWVVRLILTRFLSRTAESVVSSYDKLLLPIEGPPFELNEFIARGYEGMDSNMTIRMTRDIPMHAGSFLNQHFDRPVVLALLGSPPRVMPYRRAVLGRETNKHTSS